MVDNVRLPVGIEEGATGGPRFQTTIHSALSGHEQRISEWDLCRIEVDIAYGIRDETDIEAILKLFLSRGGKLSPFRFKWWQDYSASGQSLGTGDGVIAAYQLRKTYTDTVLTYTRTIYLPVSGTLAIYVNGVEKTEATHYSVNYSTGVVTFAGGSIPPNGHAITADFEFDLPMRFDDDHLKFRLLTATLHTVPSIPLIEVIGE